MELQWLGYFCAGSVLVNLALTCISVKLFTEFAKERFKSERN